MEEYVLFFLLQSENVYAKFATGGDTTDVYTKAAGERAARRTKRKKWGRPNPESSAILAYIRGLAGWNTDEFIGSLGRYNVGEPQKGMADVLMTPEDAERMKRDWEGKVEVYKRNEVRFET